MLNCLQIPAPFRQSFRTQIDAYLQLGTWRKGALVVPKILSGWKLRLAGPTGRIAWGNHRVFRSTQLLPARVLSGRNADVLLCHTAERFATL